MRIFLKREIWATLKSTLQFSTVDLQMEWEKYWTFATEHHVLYEDERLFEAETRLASIRQELIDYEERVEQWREERQSLDARLQQFKDDGLEGDWEEDPYTAY